MTTINRIEGTFTDASNARYAILCSRFNEFIVNKLESAAIDTLIRHGVKAEDIDIYYVPGAHELPICAQRCAATEKYQAIIALGAVIKGGTAHFDVVVNEQAKGLSQVALKYDIPVITGVLTTNNIEQAIERAGTKAGNKGHDAAMAALEMVSLLGKIQK
ncbi:6,7-dimethyl-8-ribityllumazine synthase [Suttonella ornithocola]|uniref:6,7-dimethyl-8-ribityllumazine synthase n=1 Tax=Suttonella ornithocola TaxID=279832 RepID=A0A380MXZ7_9GAMM|nr:6,7-dimethyl-8-ribityllumazine synthase [Suttonella ornithocola]SUO97162.1 6,7-dimethyl-8-ribityllumazine synthase [Suttonella ornithocola]